MICELYYNIITQMKIYKMNVSENTFRTYREGKTGNFNSMQNILRRTNENPKRIYIKKH